MKYNGTLIVVKDVNISKKFYMDLFNLEVEFDFVENVSFKNAFSIQEKFDELIGIAPEDIKYKTNNMELYFEVEDMNAFLEKLNNYKNIEYIHNVKEYSWGQKSIRFYDPDHHIIEVGDNMDMVIKKFLNKGMSIEETSKVTQHPVSYIKNLIEN